MSAEKDLFEFRETIVVPHSALVEIDTEPERVRVVVAYGSKSVIFDIGAIAYFKRVSRSEKYDDRGTSVLISSLIPARRKLLFGIFDLVWGYQNGSTVRSMYQKILQIFEWCDSRHYSNVFVEPIATSSIYREYSDYLYDRLQKGSLKPLTAHALQRFFCRLIEVAFPKDHQKISGVAVTIPSQRRLGRGASAADVSTYIRSCLALARGLGSKVLSGVPFPWRINFESFEVVIFPGNNSIYTPYVNCSNKVHNVEALRISTVDEYIAKSHGDNTAGSRRRLYPAADVKSAEENLAKANADLRNEFRLRYAIIAAKAYANLFIAITGCSPAELSQFDFLEAVEIERSAIKKELSAVKFRAAGRRTRYALGVGVGIELLKEYFKLRQWLLNGASCDRLFFAYSERQDPDAEIKPISATLTYELYDHMKGRYFAPEVPHLGSRMFRRNKSLVLHALGFEPRVVADVLNHAMSTNLADYTGGTVEKQNQELGLFWKSVRRASEVVRDRVSPSAMSIAAGHCESFNNPIRVVDSTELTPVCINQFGCLFCQNYFCHPDVEDIHKLLSLHYVIQVVRRSGSNFDHAEHLFKKLSIRLQYILSEITARSLKAADLVASTRKQVEEYGILTPFWERRLQRYEMLGVKF